MSQRGAPSKGARAQAGARSVAHWLTRQRAHTPARSHARAHALDGRFIPPQAVRDARGYGSILRRRAKATDERFERRAQRHPTAALGRGVPLQTRLRHRTDDIDELGRHGSVGVGGLADGVTNR